MEVDIIITIGDRRGHPLLIVQIARILRTARSTRRCARRSRPASRSTAELVEQLDTRARPGADFDQRVGYILIALSMALIVARRSRSDRGQLPRDQRPGGRSRCSSARRCCFGSGWTSAATASEPAAEPAGAAGGGGRPCRLRRLVRDHESPLRRFTRRLAGDDGDDLAQEAFLKAWRAIGQWRGDGGFRAGSGRIATRRFLDARALRPDQSLPEPKSNVTPIAESPSTGHWPASHRASAPRRCSCSPRS